MKSFANVPAFPISFVIVKDVVIEFKASESDIKSVHDVMDKKSSSGGGIFCFSAASSSATRDDNSSLHAHSQGENFRITIPSPQILAWYLQLIPEDKSKLMDIKAQTISGGDKDLNIIQFVKAMRDYKTEK